MPTSMLNGTAVESANCKITVHSESLYGPPTLTAQLQSHLYYSISCEPIASHCLKVSHCYLASKGISPYTIIDKNGCSNELDLFSDITYLNDHHAIINNPVPVKFRDAGDSMMSLTCDTVMRFKERNGTCIRIECR
uniref:ZP domain-containing protein n=1 Tax=Rhabditophanes sp. KR3021 TaxID=114890 RepID=A0AC35TXE2_9BILA